MAIECRNWDSWTRETLRDENGRNIGSLEPRATLDALGYGIQSWSRPDGDERDETVTCECGQIVSAGYRSTPCSLANKMDGVESTRVPNFADGYALLDEWMPEYASVISQSEERVGGWPINIERSLRHDDNTFTLLRAFTLGSTWHISVDLHHVSKDELACYLFASSRT